MRRYIGRRKRELGEVEVMVPQVKTPGAEAEVDFFQASVIMSGIQVVLWFFQMRACYSGRVFVRAVGRATQQAFLESMVLGLEHFGGVFGAIRMDNHRSAVVKVLRGRTREESDRYIALRSHYLFETRYCLPGEKGAHEKGGVEGGQGHFRRNHMVPLPECRDLRELNEQLLAACHREDERVAHGQTGTKLMLWQLKAAALRPLPEERFSTVEYVDSIRVDEKSRARVKSVRYSVPSRLAGLQVRAEVSSDRVLIFHRGEQVANWERCWEPNVWLKRRLTSFVNASALSKPRAFRSEVVGLASRYRTRVSIHKPTVRFERGRLREEARITPACSSPSDRSRRCRWMKSSTLLVTRARSC